MDNDSGSGSDVVTKDVGTKDTSSSDTGSHADTGGTPDGSPTDGTSDVVATDAGGDSGGTTCAAIGTGMKQFNVTGTCATCLAASCCATLTTCVDSAQCLDILNCGAACPADAGMACETNCATMHIGGIGAAQKFGNCESKMCSTEC